MLKREVSLAASWRGLIGRSPRSGCWALVFAVAAGLSALWALALAGSAAAATPCGTSGVFSQSGATATCTYTNPGSEDTFAVPAGVSSVSVVAIGAQGGAGTNNGGGGSGRAAQVSNMALPVPSGASQLWVEVCGPGAVGACGAAGATPGGSFDGGAGWSCGGGGGGSSAVLTVARARASRTGNTASDSRLLVAGCGGTGEPDFAIFGGSGGNSAVTGAGGGGCNGDGGAGGVGPTDGSSGGGTGGCNAGGAGTAATGGGGGNFPETGGGGGGGGWFGGGGGGLSGGGGGGSRYGGAGPSGGISISTASFSQAPEVVISYTPLTANDLAAKLVRDSTGKGPGKPLENEAAAIQAAVSAGNKATVCADIIDYLGLVKAQTNKKVTVAEGTLLTTDATDLANAVGC